MWSTTELAPTSPKPSTTDGTSASVSLALRTRRGASATARRSFAFHAERQCGGQAYGRGIGSPHVGGWGFARADTALSGPACARIRVLHRRRPARSVVGPERACLRLRVGARRP